MTTSPFEERGGWPAVLGKVSRGDDLDAVEARGAMAEILDGAATSAQIAAFIVALRMKGASAGELGGLVDAMLDVAQTVPLASPEEVVDIVGTGGDQAHTINVSTLASFVVAGAGAKVCKHGNRAASSKCGTADVLEALGVVIDLGPDGVATCVDEAGIGFCFAPRFHPAMRHAGPTRGELGIPTVFNFLGPLSNPGRVRRHLIGLADPSLARRMLEVLRERGSVRALLVHGDDGLDELTTTTGSTVLELRDGTVTEWHLDPAVFDLEPASPEALRGGDATENARLARAVLAGDRGPHRDIVVLNAAAALMAAGVADDLGEGLTVAAGVLDDGRAAAVLDALVAVSTRVRAAGRG